MCPKESGTEFLKLHTCTKKGIKLESEIIYLDVQGAAELYLYDNYSYVFSRRVFAGYSDENPYAVYKKVDGARIRAGEQIHCAFVQPPSLRVKFNIADEDKEGFVGKKVKFVVEVGDEWHRVSQPSDYALPLPSAWKNLSKENIKDISLCDPDWSSYFAESYVVRKSGTDIDLLISVKKKHVYDMQVQFEGLGGEYPDLIDWGVDAGNSLNSDSGPQRKDYGGTTWSVPAGNYQATFWKLHYQLQRKSINVKGPGNVTVAMKKANSVNLRFMDGHTDVSSSYRVALLGADKWGRLRRALNEKLDFPINDGRRYVLQCIPLPKSGMPMFLYPSDKLKEAATLQVPETKTATVNLTFPEIPAPTGVHAHLIPPFARQPSMVLIEDSGIQLSSQSVKSGEAVEVVVPQDGYHYKIYFKQNNIIYPLQIPAGSNPVIEQSMSLDDFKEKGVEYRAYDAPINK